MRSALVCIAKNEDNYIQEWVDYNLKLGFDTIFIYENFWKCPINHPQVVNIPHDDASNSKQPNAYALFKNEHGDKYDFAAFFDVDEFLVLKQHQCVNDFLAERVEYPAIAVNWASYGDSGLTEVIDNNYSLLKRFTKRKIFHAGIKTILNLKLSNWAIQSVHCAFCVNMVCPAGFSIPPNSSSNPNGNYDIAQLNHYSVKTLQEFRRKQSYGLRACNNPLHDHDFRCNNFNEVEDKCALEFFEK
jgi:hypothetical protein